MFTRLLQKKLTVLSRQYPIVTITGPRQSGKTTLVKMTFPRKEYVSLEAPDIQEFAQSDPRGFLNQYPKGAVLDEIQRVPELLSYLQTIVDDTGKNGMFILTGSQQFLLLDRVSQSLAGRTALLRLLPLSLEEMHNNSLASRKLDAVLLKGCYPRIYDQKLKPSECYAGYLATYVERDVRSIKNIGNLSLFRKFLRLCAARSGQLLNLSEIGNACGIQHNTVKSWISVLEASYIIFLLQPHHANFNKRLVKSPKLYFLDTGLLCYLLNIRDERGLPLSPYKGQLFETFVMGEALKYFCNRGEDAPLYFWRDKTGHEVDCVIDLNNRLVPIEIKSGKTVMGDYFKNLEYWKKLAESTEKSWVIYGGSQTQHRTNVSVVSWNMLNTVFDELKI